MAIALGLIAWRGSDIVSRTPASPGPLSQSEASLLSVAEAMAGQGHVRISIVRHPGAVRQVLLLVDDKTSVDDGMLTNTISIAAGLDATKGERVDLQRVAFAPGVTGAPMPRDWAELSLLALLAGLAGWIDSNRTGEKKRLLNWCRKRYPPEWRRSRLNLLSALRPSTMTMPPILPAGIQAAPPMSYAPG